MRKISEVYSAKTTHSHSDTLEYVAAILASLERLAQQGGEKRLADYVRLARMEASHLLEK
jgi:hypothetical protein